MRVESERRRRLANGTIVVMMETQSTMTPVEWRLHRNVRSDSLPMYSPGILNSSNMICAIVLPSLSMLSSLSVSMMECSSGITDNLNIASDQY